MVSKLKTFFRESYQELNKVNWPTKQETIRYTLFVVFFSLIISTFLGFIDFIFLKGLESFILK